MSQPIPVQDSQEHSLSMDSALRQRITEAYAAFFAEGHATLVSEEDLAFAAFLLKKFGVGPFQADSCPVTSVPTLPAVTPRNNVPVGIKDPWLEQNAGAALWFLENRAMLAEALAAASDPAQAVTQARDARRYRVIRAAQVTRFPSATETTLGGFEVWQDVGDGDTHTLRAGWLDDAVDEVLRDDPALPMPTYDDKVRSSSDYADRFEQRYQRRPTAHEFFMAGVREGRMRAREESVGEA